jgi:hypothetical protein
MPAVHLLKQTFKDGQYWAFVNTSGTPSIAAISKDRKQTSSHQRQDWAGVRTNNVEYRSKRPTQSNKESRKLKEGEDT